MGSTQRRSSFQLHHRFQCAYGAFECCCKAELMMCRKVKNEQVSGLATERVMTSISTMFLWNNTTEKRPFYQSQGTFCLTMGTGVTTATLKNTTSFHTGHHCFQRNHRGRKCHRGSRSGTSAWTPMSLCAVGEFIVVDLFLRGFYLQYWILMTEQTRSKFKNMIRITVCGHSSSGMDQTNPPTVNQLLIRYVTQVSDIRFFQLSSNHLKPGTGAQRQNEKHRKSLIRTRENVSDPVRINSVLM